jgi:hypothetical protein
MCDSSSKDLLDEFHQKRKAVRLAPIVGVVGGGTLIALLVADVPSWIPGVALVVALVGVATAHLRDQLTKTVVLFYELEPDSERDYQGLHDAFAALRAAMSAWHVEAEGDVKDRKRSAGATSVVRKKSISLSKTSPPFVKTNIEVPSLPAGRQIIYFFPDRLLVFEPKGVGAISYSDLQLERAATRFIEDGSVPPDATVVDRTWRYVNKKGGPDRRFKDNKELPIALYEDLHLRSRSGLNELFQFSKADIGAGFEAALQNLAKNVPRSR